MPLKTQDEIIRNWPKEWDAPVVTIRCTVFNHEKYIEDCIKGFLIQETNFPFEIFIHDDASTDNSAQIIKKYVALYPKIFLPIYEKENLYSKKNGSLGKVTWNPQYIRGKYVAICEGDDYWIDPFKLQKQVDYLETHPDCGLVRSEINRLFQKDGSIEECFFTKIRDRNNADTFEDYIWYGWFAAPCTWVFRKEIRDTLPVLNPKKYFTGDTRLILHIASKYKIYFMHDVTTVYRVLEKSASHFDNPRDGYRFWCRVKNTRQYFAKKTALSFRIKFYFLVKYQHFQQLKALVNAYIKKWLQC